YGNYFSLHDRAYIFFSSIRRHTRCYRDWSSDVCSSDLGSRLLPGALARAPARGQARDLLRGIPCPARGGFPPQSVPAAGSDPAGRGPRRGGRAVRRALPRLDGCETRRGFEPAMRLLREVEAGTRDQRRGLASPLAVHGVGASLRRSLVASLRRKPWTPVDARCRLVPLNAGRSP